MDGWERDPALRAYLEQMQGYAVPEAVTQLALVARAQAGDLGARDALVAGNWRLVYALACDFTSAGASPLDAVQDGNLGLLRAIAKFDGARGVDFSTYAVWWIRQAISRGRRVMGHAIRQPDHVHAAHHLVQRMTQKLTEQGQPVTDAALLNAGVSAAQLRAAHRWMERPVSLDQPAGEGEDTLSGHIADGRDAFAALFHHDLGHELAGAWHTLSALERATVTRRYLSGEDSPPSYVAIGRELGYSREAIRNAEERALKKMRRVLLTQSTDAVG